MPSRRGALALVSGAIGAGLQRPALAQAAWPSRPITIIVPFGPGGGTDILARLLAQHIAPALGQSVLVDNRAGATGTVGMAALARARPDGYTLAIAPNGTFAMAPPLLSLPYDNDRAFAPIGCSRPMPCSSACIPRRPGGRCATRSMRPRRSPASSPMPSRRGRDEPSRGGTDARHGGGAG